MRAASTCSTPLRDNTRSGRRGATQLANRGYHSYRGRRSTGKVLLIVASILLLLVAALLFTAQRYLVVEDDGSLHIVLPWGQAQRPAPAPEDDPPLDVVIEPEPEPEPEPDPAPTFVPQIRELPLGGGWTGTLDGQNAVAVRVKDDEGRVYLAASGMDSAVFEKVAVGDREASSTIALAAASEYYTVARITALHDSTFSNIDRAHTAILQLNKPGKRWYDHNSTCYLAPEKEKARAYLCTIAADCAAMGFDELLFDEFGYPPQAGNRISNIDESARTISKEEALSLLAAELRAAVPEEVVLSVQLDAETVLTGADECRGQNTALLAEAFDRIYVETTEADLPVLEAALGAHAAKLVPILAAPRAEGAYLLSAA